MDASNLLSKVAQGKVKASRIALREASAQYCRMPKKTRKARIILFFKRL